jgi:hypothetical protein
MRQGPIPGWGVGNEKSDRLQRQGRRWSSPNEVFDCAYLICWLSKNYEPLNLLSRLPEDLGRERRRQLLLTPSHWCKWRDVKFYSTVSGSNQLSWYSKRRGEQFHKWAEALLGRHRFSHFSNRGAVRIIATATVESSVPVMSNSVCKHCSNRAKHVRELCDNREFYEKYQMWTLDFCEK